MSDENDQPTNENIEGNGSNEQPSEPPKEQKPSATPQDAGDVTGVYEMLWDCPACGTKKLLGVTHKFCPSCGHAQDAKYRYFPSEQEQIAVKDHVYYGADKICGACSTPNSAKADFCTQCGSPMDQAKGVEIRESKVTAEGESFGGETKADAKKERAMASGGTPPEPPKPPFWRTKWGMGLIGGGVAVIALLATSIFWTKTVQVDVTGHSWQRIINVEDYNWRNKSDWCNQTPGDAVILSRRSEVRSYNQVPDGETCSNVRVDQGDGSFRSERKCTTKYRKEPVYDNMCYYRVLRWELKRNVKAGGDNVNDTLQWPTPNLRPTGSCVGCEREGTREQTYTVYFHNKAKDSKHECKFEEAKWKTFEVNKQYNAKAGVIFNDLRCDSVQVP